MKFPKEGEKDNDLAEFIRSIRFFDNLTINEVSILLMMFFNNLFHLILSLSKRIDLNPVEDMKAKYQRFMKKTFTSHFLCEFIDTKAYTTRQLEIPVQEWLFVDGTAEPAVVPAVAEPPLVELTQE
jgi:hypothetical protein